MSLTGRNGSMKTKILRCNYCGASHKRPEWLLKIYSIFKDKYYLTCTVCHKTSCYRLWLRAVHDVLDPKERAANKGKLWDDRI